MPNYNNVTSQETTIPEHNNATSQKTTMASREARNFEILIKTELYNLI
jgi:hypothetical protein